MSHDHGYGRRCPGCGEPMSNMPILNLRQCATGCKKAFEWHLDAGQKPLFTESRDRGLQSCK